MPNRHWTALAVLLSLACLPACGSSPASPTTASAAQTASLSGLTADALTGLPVAGVTITVDGVTAVSGPDGTFRVAATAAGVCSLVLSGPGVVQRQTAVSLPMAGAALSLIPAAFDLASFDEMCRNDGQLHRWTSPPALVVIDAVLGFSGLNDTSFTALAERVSESDRASIVADLRWGLPQVTGGAFGDFASVTVESPEPGASVDFGSREGQIVVARFKGLAVATGYAGYGRWARRGNVVVAGAMMLDRAFDARPSPSPRSLRVHELGHALGYEHVTRRASFMNDAAVLEPNAFDRDATRVAFLRAPGTQCPDHDPPQGTAAGLTSATPGSAPLAWGPATR